jgi:HSP20 family protein
MVPPIDLYETADAVVVETPLAGIDPKHIDISIEQNLLTIKGVTERKTEVDEKNYYRKEVRQGTVFRQVPLPTAVEGEKASANYENGILKIQLPKRASLPSTKVKVDIKKIS